MFIITRGWRPIRDSNPSRLMRSSSLSRRATSCAECASPEINDISPTVSPGGTCATRRRAPRVSSTNTPRQPVTTRNNAESFSPSRSRSTPPGSPNQLASANSLFIAASPTSFRSGKAQDVRAETRDKPSSARCERKKERPYSSGLSFLLAYHWVQPPSTATLAPVT